jgi:multidrug efflux pump
MRRSLGTAVFSGMIGVTAFGIFLTPVFFRVLQGVGETRLFEAAPTRWCGTCGLGAGLGAALGFLLGRVGHGHPTWGPIVGGCAGTLASLLVLGLRRRIKQARGIRAQDVHASVGGPRP